MEFCYECQGHNPIERMSDPCSVCEGRKCDNHGGGGLTCTYCGFQNMCWDCRAFARCCHEFVNNDFRRKSPGSPNT
jgi:hypothetical protein